MGIEQNISKEANEHQTQLLGDYSYSLGKFKIILNDETGELKVIVSTNNENLLIKPSSGNSAILIASR